MSCACNAAKHVAGFGQLQSSLFGKHANHSFFLLLFSFFFFFLPIFGKGSPFQLIGKVLERGSMEAAVTWQKPLFIICVAEECNTLFF